MHTKPEKNRLLDVNINDSPIDDIVTRSVKAIETNSEQIHIACANPHSLVTAQHDHNFLNALNDAEILVADGSGIIFLNKLLRSHTPPRITGHDCFEGLLKKLQENGKGKIFFFGSSEKVLGLIKTQFKKDYPALELCGMISPPYREWDDDENSEMIKTINAADPDVIWVGMTAPKQEKWVFNNREKLDATVIGSIGAVFDFVAGTHPRAPTWMTKSGIEWLYRLIREPKRMWQRNFVSTPVFLYLGIKDRFFN